MEDSIYSCRMTRGNRKDLPKEFEAANNEVKAFLKERESIFCHRNSLDVTA